MQHILTAEQFDDEQMRRLFNRADYFRKNDTVIASRRKIAALHTGRVMLSMF